MPIFRVIEDRREYSVQGPMRTYIVLVLTNLLACSCAATPAPVRPGTAPLLLKGVYPVRVIPLTSTEQALRTKSLEQHNPGWTLDLDDFGYLRSATSEKDVGQKTTSLDDRDLQIIRDFVEHNREVLGRLDELQVGAAWGKGSRRLIFEVQSLEQAKELDPEALHQSLLVGTRVRVTKEECPPCQPDGDCECITDVLFEEPATSLLTELAIDHVEFWLEEGIEIRRAAFLRIDEQAVEALMPNGIPPYGSLELSRFEYIDAVTGERLTALLAASEKTERRSEGPSPKPGLWIHCLTCAEYTTHGPY